MIRTLITLNRPAARRVPCLFLPRFDAMFALSKCTRKAKSKRYFVAVFFFSTKCIFIKETITKCLFV